MRKGFDWSKLEDAVSGVGVVGAVLDQGAPEFEMSIVHRRAAEGRAHRVGRDRTGGRVGGDGNRGATRGARKRDNGAGYRQRPPVKLLSAMWSCHLSLAVIQAHRTSRTWAA